MSKQINFYMSKKIQEEFIEFLKMNSFMFLDTSAKSINEINLENISSLYLYKHNYGNIIMNSTNLRIMDSIKSPIIQYKKTIIKENQKHVLRGRLWMANQYYDDSGYVISKEEMLLKDYRMLVCWIKKNVPYQKIKKGDHYIKEYVSDELKELQEKEFIFSI